MPLLAALTAATGTPGIGAFLFPLLDLLKNEEKPTTPNPNLRLATSLGVGGVGSLRLHPLFVPSTAVPSRPPRLFWINRSTDLLPLSLFPSPLLSISADVVR